MVKKIVTLFIFFIITLVLAIPPHVDAQNRAPSPQSDIKKSSQQAQVWKGKTFTRYTYEEDIKDTLRAMGETPRDPAYL